MKMREYELSMEEWNIVKDLADVLKVSDWSPYAMLLMLASQIFKDMTLFFSHLTPNLTKVIPAMDHIDQYLTTLALNSTYHLDIRSALVIGKKLLNKYYTMSDHLEVYHIAMSKFFLKFFHLHFCSYIYNVVLHPSHKLTYFQNAGWSDEWIATAQKIVKMEFK